MLSSKAIYHTTTPQVGTYQNIPEQLRQIPNWVLWKKESVYGRVTKVPYQPNGRKAKSNDPSTWSRFSEVLEALPGFDGIGWCVPIDKDALVHYWGIDVDDAIDPDTSEYRIWGELPTDFPGAPIQPADILTIASYAEKTPSGAGFRVIAKAGVPVPAGKQKAFGQRNPATGKIPGVEMYSSGRFFTFTGNHIPCTPKTVEIRNDEVLALHGRLHPKATVGPSLVPAKSRSSSKTLDDIEQLALELYEGRIGASRNNLIFATIGTLLIQGWKRTDIKTLLKYLIVLFHEADPSYNVDEMFADQVRSLDTLYGRRGEGEQIPSFTALSKEVRPETLELVRTFKATAKTAHSVEETLTLIRQHPPESYDRQEIKYLIEPEIPKGALVMVTGKPGCGKSTLIMHWCNTMAKNGNEVLYLDRDNPLFIAQDRIERFGGKTIDGLMYWGLWSKDANGEPLEPPFPDAPFLRDAVAKMKNPVVVFDTLATFSSGDENDNSVMGATFKSLRYLANLGATVIVVHHTAKSDGSDYRGASAMEGAVDALIKVVGTIEEGKLIRMEVQTRKTRIGDGKTIVYGMVDGIPIRQTETFQDRLFDLLKRNPGVSKDKFEEIAKQKGFRRSTIRESIVNWTVGGMVTYQNRRLSVRLKEPEQQLACEAVGGFADEDV